VESGSRIPVAYSRSAGGVVWEVKSRLLGLKDLCVELDAHVGYDPAATQATRQSVKNLLKTVFKLN
jgi:hypothetical protein